MRRFVCRSQLLALCLLGFTVAACGGDGSEIHSDVAADLSETTSDTDAAVGSDGQADDVDRPAGVAALAPSLSAQQVADMTTLGPTLIDDGVNFSVFSAHATRIELLIFDDPDASEPTSRLPMERFGDVWNLFVADAGRGTHYGYVAWGPNWPWDPAFTPGTAVGYLSDVDAQGNRFNPNKLLIDPYAKALHRDHDWSKGIPATGHGRLRSTWGAAAKSVVVKSEYVWSEHETEWRRRRADPDAPGNGWHEQIAYEAHVKGFTAVPASGVADFGTFAGFANKADYLVELGITAVELMPIHEKPLDGGYWGYQPLNYFYPENAYAAADTPTGVIDEFKAMVDKLHQAGLEVWIDVVYNHTGEGGLWTQRPSGFEAKDTVSLYSYRGLDNQSYYALSPDGSDYWPNTGVGNQTRTNHRPFRQLTLDSLRYYVEEMHVDGFRFDLAPVLGASDSDYDAWDESGQSLVDAIIDDPVLRAHNTRIIAEPWAVGGSYAFQLGGFPSSDLDPGVGWQEWNAHFRTWWRSFVNDDAWRLDTAVGPIDGGGTLTGSYALFEWNGRRPYHSVNFVTVHDGFTLYDVFTYDEKHNDCGPLVPICCNEPDSPWCDPDGGDDENFSRDWGEANEPFKRQLMRNLFVAVMVSHGTPLLLGGDEWLRTQLGNNNAWTDSADTSANWHQWGTWRQDAFRHRMVDFVSKLTRLRRQWQDKLSPRSFNSGPQLIWRNAAHDGDPDWSGRHLALHYPDDSLSSPLLILINMERHDVEFTLPPGTWSRLVDTQRWFDDAPFFEGSDADENISANVSLGGGSEVTGRYGVKDSSIVILHRGP